MYYKWQMMEMRSREGEFLEACLLLEDRDEPGVVADERVELGGELPLRRRRHRRREQKVREVRNRRRRSLFDAAAKTRKRFSEGVYLMLRCSLIWTPH